MEWRNDEDDMSTVWEMLGPEKQREIELRASREMLAYHMGDPTPITTVTRIMEEEKKRKESNS
jgi:hypothetical protein